MNSGFDLLSPPLAIEALEEAYALRLDGTVQAYPSYVNRVYGVRDESGRGFVAKFYRPGRWPLAALEDEHRFLRDCVQAAIPVAVPLCNLDGESISELVLETDDAGAGDAASLFFALFPRVGGRNFEPETEADWLRLGTLVGRLHAVGRASAAPGRPRLGPELAQANLAAILPLVSPDLAAEFEELACEGLERAAPRFDGLPVQRIHGDLHRGNILDNPERGLVLLDFDDMMMGPAAQDLWLLLPGRAAESGRELALLEEGYAAAAASETAATEASALGVASFALFEPLRFYRMIHFLAWRARQREDYWFRREFPEWGSRAFWLKEIEDLRDALVHLRAGG